MDEQTPEEKIRIWRARAEEWRTQAERTVDPDRRAAYYELAQSYDALAEAEERRDNPDEQGPEDK